MCGLYRGKKKRWQLADCRRRTRIVSRHGIATDDRSSSRHPATASERLLPQICTAELMSVRPIEFRYVGDLFGLSRGLASDDADDGSGEEEEACGTTRTAIRIFACTPWYFTNIIAIRLFADSSLVRRTFPPGCPPPPPPATHRSCKFWIKN